MRSKRLTTEIFIKRANSVHKDKYDYSDTTYISMDKKVSIKCPTHGVFEQLASNHVNPKIKAGCPFCAGKMIIKGENDLQSQFPEIAAFFDEYANKISADEVFAHSNKKAIWKCDNGEKHSYSMSINNKVSRNQGCPICSGQMLLPGFNDLQTRNPEIAAEWDYFKNTGAPSDYSYGSGYKAWWICIECGESYKSPINVHIRGHKCPYCAGQKIITGRNDLQTLYPDIGEEFSDKNEVKANEISPMTHKKYLFKCSLCNREYKASPKKRVLNGTGCPFCCQSSGEQIIRKVLDEYNVNYKTQEWFDDLRDINPLRFDFTIYLDKKWIAAIEYNGQQHYKPIALWGGEAAKAVLNKHDLMKAQYCLEHGIPLLIIPYHDYAGDAKELTIKFLRNLGLIEEEICYED